MKKFLVVLMMFVAINANAQWVQCIGSGVQSVYSLGASGNNILAGTPNGVYLSTNFGTNWIQTDLDSTFVYSFVSKDNLVFAGTGDYPNGTGGVFVSSNNGLNWTKTSLIGGHTHAMIVVGNNIFAGLAYDNWGVHISTNNGGNWTQTALTGKVIYSMTNIGNNIFAGTIQSGVYLSTNNGVSWTQTGLIDQAIFSLSTIGNNLFAGTSSPYLNNSVYLSTNNGNNWTQTSLGIIGIYSLASYGNNLFAGTFNNFYSFGGVYLSTNNGTNWINKNQGFNNLLRIYSLLIINNYIFAGTYDNYVWRRSLSEIIGIQNISTETPSKYSLSQNYPNPFNSTSNLKFEISNTGDVKLIVYDIMGKEVQTLVNERLQPATYETSFDGSILNSGVYFYKLITNTFSETKKMLLIK
jgi:hypothetical protein